MSQAEQIQRVSRARALTTKALDRARSEPERAELAAEAFELLREIAED